MRKWDQEENTVYKMVVYTHICEGMQVHWFCYYFCSRITVSSRRKINQPLTFGVSRMCSGRGVKLDLQKCCITLLKLLNSCITTLFYFALFFVCLFVCFLLVEEIYFGFSHLYFPFFPLIQGWHSTYFLEHKVWNCSRYCEWHQLSAWQ